MTSIQEKNTNIEKETLFLEWRQDREQAVPRPLKHWIAEYPSFADDFVSWAVDLPLMQGDLYRAADPTEEARLGKIGRSVVAEMRARYGMAHPTLTSITEAARQRNLRLKDVAERVGVGVPIVSKLEQRLLQFATLPEALIQKLAETLEVGAEAVRDYLRQPPTLAAGAAYQYTGKAAPQVSVQQSFAEAIRSCPGMSESDKQVWLADIEA
jgi:transcriptional regulator with XRE-family HTH domain